MKTIETIDNIERRPARIGIGLLFVVSFLYLWISVSPFENLAVEPVPRAAVNQLIGAALAMVLLLAAAQRQILSLVLRPRFIIALVFGWLVICSLLGAQPITALQRLLFTGFICLMVSILLLLPSDKKVFSRWIAVFALIILGLCYVGVVLLPSRSIHQVYDLAEPQLAGDWRGIFNHKNSAAPAMIILCIIGLYLRRTWSSFGGFVIAVLAAVFLYKTNGKTAILLLPATLVITWVLERIGVFVPLAVTTLIGLLSLFVVGSAFSEDLRNFVDGLGIDSTFTGRVDIWRLSIDTFLQSPFIGQGFQSFWNSRDLVELAPFSDTWAVAASHAHNAYIESLLHGGVTALFLVFIWMVLLPAFYFRKAVSQGADRDLNLLFGRIWIYSLLAACLESNFLIGNGAMWSSMLLAVFGLYWQAKARLIDTI